MLILIIQLVSKLLETKNNSSYLTRYLGKVIRPLVLVLPKMSGYIKTFKVKDGDKNKKNKLLSFCVDDEKLLKKIKAFMLRLNPCKILK